MLPPGRAPCNELRSALKRGGTNGRCQLRMDLVGQVLLRGIRVVVGECFPAMPLAIIQMHFDHLLAYAQQA
jgi:hypothetical protein